jgi:inorganic pyrophosphatase
MIDDNERDEKIIAVCINDPQMNQYNDLEELPEHRFQEIKHFFQVYKTLENKVTAVTEILGNEDAKKIIQKSIDNYDELFNN